MRTIIFTVLFVGVLSVNGMAQTDMAQDIGWPRQVSDSKATLIYYQPQIDKWDNYKKLTGRFAFGLTPTGQQEVLGVASFTCETKTDKEARTTYLHDINYTDVRFPSTDSKSVASLKQLFLELMPTSSESISMDRVMAELNSNGQAKKQGVPVKNDPPKIFYSASPAVLLIVDGDPVLSPIEKTDMQFVVNTNWDLFFEKSTKKYFLLVNDVWLTATNLQGSWTQTKTLPKDMSVLPSGQNFDDVKQQIPPHVATDVPDVYYSNVPAELILTDGAPVFSKIPGTGLLYVSNSEDDIFIDEAQNQYYILLSGRWFRAKAFGGPWTYAGNNLPADFTKIPEDSPKGHVLASIPGTVEASDAVMLAQIPTTVVVNRAQAEAQAKATYDGTPAFSPIPGTTLQYATNTQDKVLKVGDLYYMCFQAVWFVSSSPTGPWKTADSVPQEVYSIPPSSPVYNVTYVTQTNPTSTTVEASSTSGYLGAFIIGATVGAIIGTAIVYGTGWYYPPYLYWGPGALYPVYHPWPCTYGGGAVYNPWTGGFAAGRRVYGPYGAAGTAAWYNPATGRYGRSASVQGWYGGRTAANTYNPWTGSYGHTSQGHNPYAQWGHSTVTNGYQWARSGHVTTANGTAFGYQTSDGKSGVVVNGRNGIVVHNNTGNHIYAGPDGNVYRKESNGGWSEYSREGNWNQVHNNGGTVQRPTGASKPNTTLQGLNRSALSRERGQQQSSRYQHFQRTGEKHTNGIGGTLRKERR